MDSQNTENTLAALVAPWPLLKKNLHNMTYDGSETYSNEFIMSKLTKNDYSFIKMVEYPKSLTQTVIFPITPKKAPPKLEELQLTSKI